MTLQRLRAYSLCYMASPYSRYAPELERELALEKAFEDACAVAAALIAERVMVFSPIAHSHAICKHGGINPLDHDVWLAADAPMMDASDCLVIVKLPGFDESYGVNYEKDVFIAAGKDVFELDPETLELTEVRS